MRAQDVFIGVVWLMIASLMLGYLIAHSTGVM